MRLNSLIFLSVILLYSCVTNAKPYPVNKQEVVVKNPSGLAEPITIYKTSGRGPGILKWHKHLEPGFYVLQVMIKTGNCRRDFVVNVDSNIIGTRIGYFSQDNVCDVFIHNFNFNIVNSGVHTISIKRFQVIHWYGQHEELQINGLRIKKRPEPEVWDAYKYHHPGHSYNYLWGWHASSSYQRPNKWKMTREYWDKRIIDEAFKWGSNYVQLYPYAYDEYIQGGNFDQAIAYGHEQGFLIDQHHGIMRKLDRRAEKDFEEYMKSSADDLFKSFFDSANVSRQLTPDGFDSEDRHATNREELPLYGKDHVVELTNKVWEYFPGSFISECYKLATSECVNYENNLHQGFHGPNYSKVSMCAGSIFRNGYDDLMAIEPFGQNRAFKNEWNQVYRCAQADSRPYTNNKFGGLSMTDWIVKQCQDFFRTNALAIQEGRLPIASALSWLGEPSSNLPESMRKDIYALSMDPCRSALAYKLASTGRDGMLFWNYPRRAVQKFTKGTGEESLAQWNRRFNEYLPRQHYPGHTTRQHNGILAVNHQGMADKADLVWDTQNLGEFDADATKLTLLKNLFAFDFEQEPKQIDKRIFDNPDDVAKWTLKLKPGFYNLKIEYKPLLPNKMEVWYCEQYLGSAVMVNESFESFTFYVSDDYAHDLVFKFEKGSCKKLVCELTEARFYNQIVTSMGCSDNSSNELCNNSNKDKADNNSQFRKGINIDKEGHQSQMPAALQNPTEDFPSVTDLWFDSEAGCYLLCLRAKSQKQFQRLDITLNTHLFSERNLKIDEDAHAKPTVFSQNNWYYEYGLYGRIGAFILDENWQTFQLPVILVHDGGDLRHKIELSIPPDSEQIDFDYVKLIKMPVSNTITEMGGYLSELKQDLFLKSGLNHARQTRFWTMCADNPSVYLKIDEKIEGDLAVKNVINIHHYENVFFDGKKVNSKGTLNFLPTDIRLEDEHNILPTCTIRSAHSEHFDKIDWNNNHIELYSSKSTKSSVNFLITLSDDKKLPINKPYIIEKTLHENPIDFTNPFDSNSSLLVKVRNPEKGPYFVQEQGWWSVRGAQTVCENKMQWQDYLNKYNECITDLNTCSFPEPPVDYDLVRCIAQPKEKIKLQKFGYIENVVRPGWGSQKQLLIRDIAPDRCRVKVMMITPYIFAPRVQFNQKFNAVYLNEKKWDYHDGQNVFLPQQVGEYNIQISRKGEPHPTITSTTAKVESALYEDSILDVQVSKPAYVFKIPEKLNYKLGLKFDTDVFTIKSIQGGDLLRKGKLGAIINCRDNRVKIEFSKR